MLTKTKIDCRLLLEAATKYRGLAEAPKERVVAADIGTSECGLCKQYYTRVSCCTDCPIATHTGAELCKGTPHDACSRSLVKLKAETSNKPYATLTSFRRNCIKMAVWLEQLAIRTCGSTDVLTHKFHAQRVEALAKLVGENNASAAKPKGTKPKVTKLLPAPVGMISVCNNRKVALPSKVSVGSICTHGTSNSIIIKTGTLKLSFFGPNRTEGSEASYPSGEDMDLQLGTVRVVGSVNPS